MKARKETIRRAVENGSMDRVNRLVSAAHLLNCEANGLIEETADILRDNGLLLGELKRYHSDFVKCADRYFREFAVMVADDRRKMDKILVSPIIYWTGRDVWEFLNMNGIPHCELYDQGGTRIGCICCPMSNYRQKLRDIRRYPHVKRGWLKAIKWLIDNGYVNHNFQDAETGFNWWISDKSFDKFYADEVLQQKNRF